AAGAGAVVRAGCGAPRQTRMPPAVTHTTDAKASAGQTRDAGNATARSTRRAYAAAWPMTRSRVAGITASVPLVISDAVMSTLRAAEWVSSIAATTFAGAPRCHVHQTYPATTRNAASHELSIAPATSANA